MAKKQKPKEPGRPVGAPNKGGSFARDDKRLSIRCTEGFNKTMEALERVTNMSPADITHEALQLYAFRKLDKPTDLYYVNRII